MSSARAGLRAFSSFKAPATRTAFPRLPQQPAPLVRSAPRRHASYQRFGGGGSRRGANPFLRAEFYRTAWKKHPEIVFGSGAIIIFTYVYNLEEVPVTHRRRWNIVSPSLEKKLAGAGYEGVLNQYKGRVLPKDHPYTRLAARVVERLIPTIPQTGGVTGEEWHIHVIDDPDQPNAFVMPGNKVFVFTGILPICKDEDGLAAVLGHEIAHNVAHHVGERISKSAFAGILALGAALLFDVSGQFTQQIGDLILSLPNSRAQESEADHIGLLMMAEACYNPQAAVELWQRMQQFEKSKRGQGAPPQILSTHPASENRMRVLEGLQQEAQAHASEKGCGAGLSQQMDDFKNSYDRQRQHQQIQIQPSRGKQKEDDDYFW